LRLAAFRSEQEMTGQGACPPKEKRREEFTSRRLPFYPFTTLSVLLSRRNFRASRSVGFLFKCEAELNTGPVIQADEVSVFGCCRHPLGADVEDPQHTGRIPPERRIWRC
jgi:hypothetical protein